MTEQYSRNSKDYPKYIEMCAAYDNANGAETARPEQLRLKALHRMNYHGGIFLNKNRVVVVCLKRGLVREMSGRVVKADTKPLVEIE